MVVLSGEELPISICLTQHRLAHQLGGPLLLQEGRAVDPPVLALRLVFLLYFSLKVLNILRSVEESLDTKREKQEHLLTIEVECRLLMIHTLMV